MANVLNYIFSHAQVTKKNLLVTMLIVSALPYWKSLERLHYIYVDNSLL